MDSNNFLKIIKSGLDIGHFLLLQIIFKEEDLSLMWQETKPRAYREALIKKGYIYEVGTKYFLTQKGVDIYNSISCQEKQSIPEKIQPITNLMDNVVEETFIVIKNLIKQKTQKTNVILPSGKTLLSPQREIVKRIQEFCQKFQVTDLEKIKKGLIDYTKDLLNDKIPYPRTLKFFIWKDDPKKGLVSDLLNYIENSDEDEEVIKDTRELF